MSFDRLTRKDFWNDPDRWEGIDDPRKTMFWEVRRPDRIDIPKSATSPGRMFDPTSAEYQRALMQNSLAQSQMQFAQYQNQLQAASFLNGLNQHRSVFWPFL